MLHINLAQASIKTKNYKKAEEHFLIALNNKSTKNYAALGLANLYDYYGDYSAATQYLNNVDLSKNDYISSEYHVFRSFLFFKLNNIKQAILELSSDNIFKGNREKHFVYFLLSSFFMENNDKNKADFYLSKSHYFDPSINHEVVSAGGFSRSATVRTMYSMSTRLKCKDEQLTGLGSCLPNKKFIEDAHYSFQDNLSDFIYDGYDSIYLNNNQCPFVYSFDSKKQKWSFETTILYKIVGKENEITQVRELSSFDGRLMVREVEPETSHIDSIKILVEDNQGRHYELLPDTELVKSSDSKYLIMNRGDEIIFNFPEFSKIVQPKKISVVAKGYYDPY